MRSRVLRTFKPNQEISRADLQLCSVYDAVFQNGLQRQLRNPAVHDNILVFRVILHMQVEPIPPNRYFWIPK